MYSASKYVPGLLGLGLLWIGANWMTGAAIERDLSTRATAALTPGLVDKPAILIAGRDALLTGTAFSEPSAAAARALVDAVPGIRLVAVATKPLAAVTPYVFSATRDGSKLALSGNVPDPAVRDTLLAAAKTAMPGVTIDDKMTYASGAPAGFGGMAGYAVAGLGNLSKGTAGLSGGTYSISGEAANAAAFDAARDALKKIGAGMTLGKAEILPSAEMVAKAAAEEAAKQAAAKAAADEAAKQAAAKAAADEAAKQAAAKAAADEAAKQAAAKAAADEVAKQAAAKAAADEVAKQAADEVAKQAAAKAAADEAAKQAAAKAAADEAAKLAAAKAAADAAAKPPTADASAAIAATGEVDIKACQLLLNNLLGEEIIKFQTGKADIDPASTGILDKLVATVRRCPTAKIEIAGYTDSDGTTAANVALSSRRAEAVVAYLVQAGLDQSHLTAKGYGEADPIASNDTPEGKAKNRRIEFVVQD